MANRQFELPGRPRVAVASAVSLLTLAVGCGADDTLVVDGAAGGSTTPPPLVDPLVGPRAAACSPGERERMDGSCEPAGVAAADCGVGFVSDGDGACDPIQPSAPCAVGMVAFLGETQCHPLAPCGAAPWGTIPVDATTQYVDDDADPAVADGSGTAPWTNLTDAVAAAADGALIAVAAGSYAAAIVDRPVRIQGVCPDQVLIDTTGATAGLRLDAGSDGSELRDLTIVGSGTAAGVRVYSNDVVIDRVAIRGFAFRGITTAAVQNLRVTRSLIEDCAKSVAILGANALFEDVVVRNGTDAENLNSGFILLQSITTEPQPADVTFRRVVAHDLVNAAVIYNDALLTIEDSYIHAVRFDSDGGYTTAGCVIAAGLGVTPLTSLSIRGSVIEDCDDIGVSVADAEAVVDTTTIRHIVSGSSEGAIGVAVGTFGKAEVQVDVQRSSIQDTVISAVQQSAGEMRLGAVRVRDVAAGSMYAAAGVLATHDLAQGTRAIMSMDGVTLERVQGTGLFVAGCEVDVRSMRITDSLPRASGTLPRAIVAQAHPTTRDPAVLGLSRVSIEGSHEVGVFVLDGSVDIEDTEVFASPATADLTQYGIAVQGDRHPATLDLRWSAIHDAQGAGLIVFHPSVASVQADHLLVEATRALAGELGDGIMAAGGASSLEGPLVTVSNSLSRDNARAGVSAIGARIALSNSALRCNALSLTGFSLPSDSFEITDLGGNDCRCTPDDRPCQVDSASPMVPTPLPEKTAPPTK